MKVHSLQRKEKVGTIDRKVIKENEFLQLLYTGTAGTNKDWKETKNLLALKQNSAA